MFQPCQVIFTENGCWHIKVALIQLNKHMLLTLHLAESKQLVSCTREVHVRSQQSVKSAAHVYLTVLKQLYM
jgi:hypothetical protein